MWTSVRRVLARVCPRSVTHDLARPGTEFITAAVAGYPDDNLENEAGPIGAIGRAVLDNLHPPRRARTSVRKVKSPLSRHNRKDPYKPEHSTPITELTPSANRKRPTRDPNRSARQQHMDLNYPELRLDRTGTGLRSRHARQ